MLVCASLLLSLLLTGEYYVRCLSRACLSCALRSCFNSIGVRLGRTLSCDLTHTVCY